MRIALSIKQLKKIYNNGFEALKGIDFSVQAGDFFALLGPNGAGKSTTIGIICSLILKTSGKVSIFGHDIDADFSRAKQHIGVVPQEFNLNNFEKAFNILVNQAGYYGIPRSLAKQRAAYYLKKLDLWDKRDTISRRLSGGMKRRLMVARALVHEPKLLILDEPTAGVDIEMRRSLWTFLRDINQQGTTIILTTHYLEEAENLCRNIAIIDDGEIVEYSSMKQLLTQLHRQVFVVDVAQPLSSVPKLNAFTTHLVDSHSFEITVDQSQNMNQLFAQLTHEGIHVTSMRNKTNRLEELFVNLINRQPLNHQS